MALLPAHALIFRGMLDRIRVAGEQRALVGEAQHGEVGDSPPDADTAEAHAVDVHQREPHPAVAGRGRRAEQVLAHRQLEGLVVVGRGVGRPARHEGDGPAVLVRVERVLDPGARERQVGEPGHATS